jgi:hypothetical protein
MPRRSSLDHPWSACNGVTSMIQREKPILPHLQRLVYWPVARWGDVSDKFLRACRVPPSGGLVIRAGMASRGKPGDSAEGGFLGGARSPRPGGKAGGGPRQVMIGDELERDRCPKGGDISLGVMPTSRACGARPSAGGEAEVRWPCGEDLGTTRKAVLSGGRTLCVRIARPYPNRGMS